MAHPFLNWRPARCVALGLLLARLSHPTLAATDRPAPCRIDVVEAGSNWPVPLVELRTTHHLRHVTDNAGVIALDDPDLLGREVWFDVIADGYEVPKDGFGYRGVRLKPQAGGRLKVTVQRTAIARRLGRLTGAGRFAESARLGLPAEPDAPEVFGCDTVQVAPYGNGLFWLWGDTTIPSYRLGLFDTLGATTSARPLSRFEPPLHLPFEHFRNPQGRLRGIAPLPGSGPTWLTALASVTNAAGRQKLVASYLKIRPPLDAYEVGLCTWDDTRREFAVTRRLWTKPESGNAPHPTLPEGHAVPWRDESGRDWLLFGNPFPVLRCPASYEGWSDPTRWEPVTAPAAPVSAGDGRTVKPHSGSIAWNARRGRWITVFMEAFGKPSAFGELWYAEAASPLGPWGPAVKVLSHANYTFYNPRLHPELTSPDAGFVLFEGTYTTQFADRPAPTPRYDYNQILYRVDLDDPQLAAAQGR